ncbi:MAG: hypothetical protein IJ617_02450 [Oscillospiraceae bacterium]|nr:hypothetical protein [Oscillospiraceae bacterium]
MRRERMLAVMRRFAILGLLLSAIVLLRQTEPFSERTGGAGMVPAVERDDAAGVEASAALRPVAVETRDSGGATAVSIWDGETTQQAFQRFSAILGEALGSAGAPEEVSEAEFRSALSGEHVFFQPGAVYPLELMSEWLGIEAGEGRGHSADLLCLGVADGAVALLFREPDSGFFRCSTAAQAETLSARITEFRGPAAAFAYENPLLEGVEPYALIPGAMPEIRALSAAPVAEAVETNALIAAVGMNSRVVTSYYDADGTLVLNEDEQTLRLGSDGTLLYRAAPAEEDEGEQELTEAVKQAFRFAEACVRRGSGSAELVFAGVERDENGRWTVFFDYSAGGIGILLAEGHAAEVTVDGGAVRRAQLYLRRYIWGEDSVTILPALQAAAAYAALGGAVPTLAYLDMGGYVRCDWVLKNAEKEGAWRTNVWNASYF